MIVMVLGGQYGDEGKGWVSQWFARNFKFDLVIRFGASNAGHSCLKAGKEIEMRTLPTSWAVTDAPIFLPETAIIDKEVFFEEVAMARKFGYKGVIWLSTMATLVDKKDLGWRKTTSKIGSMGSGVAPTRAKRLLREAKKVYEDLDFYKFALGFSKHIQEIKPILSNPNKQILIEGTQGFGLSLNFSDHYPYTTSIDLTSYQVLAECGIPFGVHEVQVVLVFRTFPVRVPNPPHGTSGELRHELSWNDVSVLCGHPIKVEYDCRPPIWDKPIPRRIGMFESDMSKRAIWHCQPSVVFLTHLDWYFPDVAITGLTAKVRAKVAEYEQAIDRKIDMGGIGKGEFLPTFPDAWRFNGQIHKEP